MAILTACFDVVGGTDTSPQNRLMAFDTISEPYKKQAKNMNRCKITLNASIIIIIIIKIITTANR